MPADTIVLGAGIIGVSAAVHLARRGKSVVLVDRRGAGEETSFGNAGLIQREGVVPYAFPQQLSLILRYALNNNIDANYHLSALPALAPFLAQYWWNSNARRHRAIAKAYAPLIEHSITEHDDLVQAAGAEHLIAKRGWMEVFRTNAVRDAEYAEAERLARNNGIHFSTMTVDEVAKSEPDLSNGFVGGLKWSDPWSVLDPHALTIAYLKLFESLGGRFVKGDATHLTPRVASKGWQIDTTEGRIEAEDVVVALGPWSDKITGKLGYRYPLGVKRGYHMHYGTGHGAKLNNWLMDKERGYFLAPMNNGIRLTTGAEFAFRDAPKSPVQLERAEKVARTIFPLGERLDADPWMGSRPCTPDMMPIIGKAPRHDGLWFAFGHAHHGLTLGPITGRILAEQMTGMPTVIDASPYRPERFNA